MKLDIRTPRVSRQRQGGAATLIVVMVLFFIISMVAGYTNRNLIFEQRAAANQYRSTLAFDAGDGGMDWALSMLNAGRVTDSCVPVTDGTTPPSFRERYIASIDPTNGNVTMANLTTANSASCVMNPGVGWNCSCPVPTSVVPPLPSSSGTASTPAFNVRFLRFGARPDLIQVDVNACSRADLACLTAAAAGSGDAKARVQGMFALRGALNRLPTGAVTVPDDFTLTTPALALSAVNADSTSYGITIHRGRITSASLPLQQFTLSGLPGVPGLATTEQNDAMLQPAAPASGLMTAAERRFALFFGMRPDVYKNQPGLPVISCASSCTGSDIAAAASANPYRPIWVTGATGTLTINGTLGSDTAPVLLITEGDVVFTGNASFKGVIYGRKKQGVGGATTEWKVYASGSNAALKGALIAENKIDMQDATATTAVEYSRDILQRLRLTYGTFVRVTASWRDF